MVTSSTFICAINSIECNVDLGAGIELIPNPENNEYPRIYITNNQRIIRDKLKKEMKVSIGQIEYNYLYNSAKLVAYADGNFDLEKIDSISYLNMHLQFLKMFFFSLWLIKDNSTDFELGFLHFRNAQGENETSSNVFASSNFNISGSVDNAVFTMKELEKASEFLYKHVYFGEKTGSSVNEKIYDRITISNYFVQYARSADDIGLKITSYCSALETLFSNEVTELSHKLSERVSRFLKKSKEERIKYFKILKQAYTIRSKVVHGGSFKQTQVQEMNNIVKEVDQICREIMQYCFLTTKEENKFLLNNEKLDDYFLELIME